MAIGKCFFLSFLHSEITTDLGRDISTFCVPMYGLVWPEFSFLFHNFTLLLLLDDHSGNKIFISSDCFDGATYISTPDATPLGTFFWRKVTSQSTSFEWPIPWGYLFPASSFSSHLCNFFNNFRPFFRQIINFFYESYSGNFLTTL